MAGSFETIAALGIGAGIVYLWSGAKKAEAAPVPTKPSGFSSYNPGSYTRIAAQTGKSLPTIEEFKRDEQAATTILKKAPGEWYQAGNYWWRVGEGKPHTEAEFVAEQRKTNPNYGKYQDSITGAWVTGQEPENAIGRQTFRDGTVIITWEDRTTKKQRQEVTFDPKVFEKYQGKPYDSSRPIKVQVAPGDMSLENPIAKKDGSFAASAVTQQGSVTIPVEKDRTSAKNPVGEQPKQNQPKPEEKKPVIVVPPPVMVQPVPGVEKPVTPGRNPLPPILPSPLPPPTVPTPVKRPGKFTPV